MMIDSVAMREAVVNVVVHNDYSYGATPKIEFFSDRVEITSMGGLPYGVPEKEFFGGYSVPRNKELMRVFRDLEIVEHLGSGIPRILKAYGKDAFEIRTNYVRIVFHYAKPILDTEPPPPQIAELESRLESRLAAMLMLKLAQNPNGKSALAQQLGHKTVSGELHKQIKRLLDLALIEKTIPDKPNSRLQKYRLTDKGRELLKNLNQGT